jgi:hypothetical protein
MITTKELFELYDGTNYKIFMYIMQSLLNDIQTEKSVIKQVQHINILFKLIRADFEVVKHDLVKILGNNKFNNLLIIIIHKSYELCEEMQSLLKPLNDASVAFYDETIYLLENTPAYFKKYYDEIKVNDVEEEYKKLYYFIKEKFTLIEEPDNYVIEPCIQVIRQSPRRCKENTLLLNYII